jgi:Haem-binding uptake, Tiki superfamily, ChaN
VKRKVQFAIGWEMFDETQQAKLDAWAAGVISLKEMLAETDFAKHWGIYSPTYEQILQIAGEAGVPNIALNAPPELPRKIARGESLTREEKSMVPTGFVGAQKGYRNFVAMMGDHPGMHEADQRRFFDAQNTWDQTMASRILEFKLRNPKVLLLVLTGRGHVSGGFGIPFYVRQKALFKQIIFAGDRTSGPRHLRRPGGKSVPIAFQNSDNLSLRMTPKTGNRRLVPWPYFASLPLNSSAPAVSLRWVDSRARGSKDGRETP